MASALAESRRSLRGVIPTQPIVLPCFSSASSFVRVGSVWIRTLKKVRREVCGFVLGTTRLDGHHIRAAKCELGAARPGALGVGPSQGGSRRAQFRTGRPIDAVDGPGFPDLTGGSEVYVLERACTGGRIDSLRSVLKANLSKGQNDLLQ